MRTLASIAAFEIKNRLRGPSTYVYFLLYALLAGLWMAAAGGAIPDASIAFGSDKILINSPDALAATIAVLGFMGVTVIAAVMGRALQQDFEHRTYPFFFTAPIRKRDYFFGRFAAAYVTLAAVFLGISAGILVGCHWPGVDPARVGPYSAQGFVRPYLFTLLPNVLWLGGVFFVIAALTRKIAPVYVAGVMVLVGFLLSLNLLHDMDNKTLAALIDPVGLRAQGVLTRYWSVDEKNTRQLALSGVLLWNRILWVSLGVLALAAGYRRFRMAAIADGAGYRSGGKSGTFARLRRRASRPDTGLANPDAVRVARASPVAAGARQPHLGSGAWLRMVLPSASLYVKEIVLGPRFLVIVGGAAAYVIGSSATMGDVFGTSTWPVTWQVLEATSGFFGVFILVVTAIYAGELVWRERDARIDEILDATPQPSWLPFAAKLLALFALQALLMLVVMASSIAVQLWHGYTRLEIGHYLFELYALQLPDYMVLAALALTIHVIVNQKYLGHALVVAAFVVELRLPAFGFEDRLYLYGSHPEVLYSDINGYGHFLPAVRAFQLYWAAAACLLLVLAFRFWVRGKETHWRRRLRLAGARGAGSAALSAATGAALLVFAGSGGWIYYNTHLLNRYLPASAAQRLQADYEKRYKQYDFAVQPHLTAIDVDVDLFPAQHRVDLRGRYTLVNRSSQPIVDLYVVLPAIAELRRIEAPIAADGPVRPLQLVDAAPELWWRHYRLAQPLQPGASTSLAFDIGYTVHGFKNDGAAQTVLDNGSFVNTFGRDTVQLPALGYSEDLELSSDRERKKFGLAPKERAHDLDDQRARQVGPDWIDHYTATIRTAPDQMALTSGTLVEDRIESARPDDRGGRDGRDEGDDRGNRGERHVLRYAMDGKFLPLLSLLSGRYAVERSHWSNGSQDVAIEIYYQPGHEFDLERMIAGAKDSLDYYTRHFAPYQFQVLRIVEFPRYARYAESFPNTVAFSESIGFIARVDDHDPKDIDYPYFVAAHEVAHQWWAHQEIPAAVQGAAFVTESLAEYSALMVLRQRYGDARMHRFLKYELDRYLFGRSTEDKKEQPLLRADGAAYLHYSKGSLALYALQDAIGEKAIDRALSSFVDHWRYKGPPYPSSRDLVAELRQVTPPAQQFMIDDLIENITLFDLHATAATWRALPDGRYEISVTGSARKLRADGLGRETEIPMDQPVDVGALDEHGVPILIEKRTVRSGSNQFTLTVDRKPARAGIDPLNKLIDRIPDDNTVAVTSD